MLAIADPHDLDFLKFIKAFFWALYDPHLFDGLAYDESESTDHFFVDRLRLMGDEFCPVDGDALSLKEFEAPFAREGGPFDDMTSFLIGVKAGEDRLRWDRIVVLHLFVIGFLNTVGYSFHKASDADIANLVARIKHGEIRRNLASWLPKLGLDQQREMRRIAKELCSLR